MRRLEETRIRLIDERPSRSIWTAELGLWLFSFPRPNAVFCSSLPPLQDGRSPREATVAFLLLVLAGRVDVAHRQFESGRSSFP